MALLVQRAGMQTTVQDGGRIGLAHLGVPHAGPVDRPAARLANRLVGNDEEAALLEITLGGCAVRPRRAVTMAVTGAPVPLTVGGRSRPLAEPVTVRADEVVELGLPVVGLRSYLAVAGGIDVPPVLGSRSTDTLVGLGPPVVADGDVLPLGPPGRRPAGVDAAVGALARPGRPVLRLLPGPRLDWFDPAAVDVLTRAPYVVEASSNRVGLRLRGEPLGRSRAGELPSEGVVDGALQVPPDGQPIVFLADHPVTGGYPVIGVVHPADLHVCAQLRPGESLSFVWMRTSVP